MTNRQILLELLEKSRLTLHQMAQEHSFNFQNPLVIEASERLDQLLNHIVSERQLPNS